MVILPLEFHFTEVSSIPELRQGRIGHIFSLPYAIEPAILLICVKLHPVIALVPCHAHLLEVV